MANRAFDPLRAGGESWFNPLESTGLMRWSSLEPARGKGENEHAPSVPHILFTKWGREQESYEEKNHEKG